MHRGLLSRVFTPKKMDALGAEDPGVLRPQPRPAGRRRAASTSSRDLGAQMPMRVIGMLLGIPEEDQEAIRDQVRRRSCAPSPASR